MYFEGLPGIAVLAAAGFTTLITRWNINRAQLEKVFLVPAALQLTHFVLTARDIQARLAPASNFHSVLRQVPCTNCIVFMQSDLCKPKIRPHPMP